MRLRRRSSGSLVAGGQEANDIGGIVRIASEVTTVLRWMGASLRLTKGSLGKAVGVHGHLKAYRKGDDSKCPR